MLEKDLFPLVQKILYEQLHVKEIYSEVINIDVIGLSNCLTFAIELKRNLNFKVIEQAIKNKMYVNYSFIAVPKPKKAYSSFVENLIKKEDLGLIYLSEDDYKNEIKFLGKNQRPSFDIRKHINPQLHTKTTAGAKSGDTLTPYKLTMQNIYFLLRSGEWIKVEDILNQAHTHFKNPKEQLIGTLRAKWNEQYFELKYEEKFLCCRLKDVKSFKEKYFK